MRKSITFLLTTLALRALHALSSLPFHIDGDMTIPWLMANDWEHTPHRRFYWGQDYLGTTEAMVLAKVGHAIFGAGGVIPLWFTVLIGQLEFVLGAALLFAAVRRLRPGFGDRAREFVLAVALLGFLPPVLEKYLFGPGAGYSLVPLATGLAVWLWVRFVGRPLGDRRLKAVATQAAVERAPPPLAQTLATFLPSGILLSLMITASRLCLVPTLALLACFAFARDAKVLLPLVAGIALGLAPELALGLEHTAHHTVSLGALVERWHNFANAWSQTGISLGLLPVALREPEDTLFVRGHAPIAPAPMLDALAMAAFLLLGWTTRQRLKERPAWIFLAIAGVNVALITVDGIAVDQASARRYSMAFSLVLSAWLLIEWRENRLVRAFTMLRLGMLAIYLAASTSYTSAFGDMGKVLKSIDFRPDQGDCLSGHGGDVTAALAFSNQVTRVVAYDWRLPGNYSKAVAASACATVFHIDTGATPVSRVECANPEKVYVEGEYPSYRPPVTIYRCKGVSSPINR